MTPATHPDPFTYPSSWCAVWKRLGGSWRLANGQVELVKGNLLADGPRLDAMLADTDTDERQAIADHLGEAMAREAAWQA